MSRNDWLMWWFNGFLVPALLVTGCGYSLSHRLKDSFLDKRGIFVPMFINRSDELGAEKTFTNALIQELQSRREVVINSERESGLVLSGEVTAISYAPTAATAYGFQGLSDFRRIPSEYGVRVNVSLRLADPKTKVTLWANSFSGFRRVNVDISRTYDYQSPSSIGMNTQSLVTSVFGDIARDIMRDAYDDMVELF